MRNYAVITSNYWTGETGQRIQEEGGIEAACLGAYLISNRHSNAIGIYYLPIPLIAYELKALDEDGIRRALQVLAQEQFSAYDEARSMVYVRNMARFQVAESLSRNDKRVRYVLKELEQAVSSGAILFAHDFFNRFQGDYQMELTPALSRAFSGVAPIADVAAMAPAMLDRAPRRTAERRRESKGAAPEGPFHEVAVPLNDGSEYSIPMAHVEEWRKLFPGIDVDQTLRDCRAWNLGNPKNRKTRDGINRHITGWLSREQNRAGGRNGGNRTSNQPTQRTQRNVDAAREFLGRASGE